MTFVYTPPEPLFTFREGDSNIIPAGTKVFTESQLRAAVERVQQETMEACAVENKRLRDALAYYQLNNTPLSTRQLLPDPITGWKVT